MQRFPRAGQPLGAGQAPEALASFSPPPRHGAKGRGASPVSRPPVPAPRPAGEIQRSNTSALSLQTKAPVHLPPPPRSPPPFEKCQ